MFNRVSPGLYWHKQERSSQVLLLVPVTITHEVRTESQSHVLFKMLNPITP